MNGRASLTRTTALSLCLIALAACGRQVDLRYPQGASGPATPAGASAPPTPPELVAPAPQSRPQRSDELLRQSDERKSDEFDLPPT
jgi:hypothetical protein